MPAGLSARRGGILGADAGFDRAGDAFEGGNGKGLEEENVEKGKSYQESG